MPPPPRRVPAAVGCDVVAHAAVRASAVELAALRRAPGTLGETAFPPGLLRHADGQTVVGLAAVLRAVRDGGLEPDGFHGWSVVSGPRFLGREAFEASFPQFLAEGAWGVSPHLISNHSLHSPSGTVSQALKAHGPNLGAGGTPGGSADALLAAASLLSDGSAEGVWVVLTSGRAGGDVGAFEAIAMALVAARDGRKSARLRVAPGAVRFDPAAAPSLSFREAIAAWLDVADDAGPTTLRVDEGHAAPRPHARPVRETRHEWR